MSTELLRRIVRIAMFALVALPLMELHASQTPASALSTSENKGIAGNTIPCSSGSKLAAQAADCRSAEQLLVAATYAGGPQHVVVVQPAQDAAAMTQAGDRGTDSQEQRVPSRWVVAILVSLIGVVAIARRGPQSGTVARRQAKRREVAYHT